MNNPQRVITFVRSRLIRLACIAGTSTFMLAPALAQNEPAAQAGGSCVLRNHVYTCDLAVFHRALSGANSIAIETHNTDGVARGELQKLITSKLAKHVVDGDSPADLVFLMIPVDQAGTVSASPGDAPVGTLRIYSATATGAKSQLLWAETCSGPPDLPWPIVVHRLIGQFQAHLRAH